MRERRKLKGWLRLPHVREGVPHRLTHVPALCVVEEEEIERKVRSDTGFNTCMHVCVCVCVCVHMLWWLACMWKKLKGRSRCCWLATDWITLAPDQCCFS